MPKFLNTSSPHLIEGYSIHTDRTSFRASAKLSPLALAPAYYTSNHTTTPPCLHADGNPTRLES